MRWIDYKKAYDMVPCSKVIESLNMMGIAENVVNFLGKTMKSWKVELTCSTETLREVPIEKEIFQVDVLSLGLFVIALQPLTNIMKTVNPGYEFQTGETINHLLLLVDLKLYSKCERALHSFIQTGKIFSEDIAMQFGIDKCNTFVMKKGKIVKANGTELPNEYK